MEKIKAVGYIRVSTGKQDNSLDVQRQRIKDYCIFQNIELVEIFCDQDVSGFKEFNKRESGALAQQKLTGDIKTIISIRPDRLFRNLQDALLTTNDWNDKGIDLHIIDMGGASFTTKTANGKLIFAMLIAYAQFERDLTGERTKSVLNKRKGDSKVYCREVFGYDKIDGKLVPNENEQIIIGEIKKMQNLKPSNIAHRLNFLGYKTKNGNKFQTSTINSIINNKIHEINK